MKMDYDYGCIAIQPVDTAYTSAAGPLVRALLIPPGDISINLLNDYLALVGGQSA